MSSATMWRPITLRSLCQRYIDLDFVPLVIAIRTIELGLQEGTKVLRSTVGEALKGSWPIGREKYNKFSTYVAAAKIAGVVQLGTSGKLIWIASTGKLERTFHSQYRSPW